MSLPAFVALGLLINLHQCLEIQDGVLREIIINQNVTGVLGEEVQLSCLYNGKHNISDSSWKRLDSGNRAKMMAGYKNGKLFAKENFFAPTSHTNLTVKVSINSLEVEGKYTCVFSTGEEEIMDSLFLSVIARPHVTTYAKEEVVNGIHYQNIFCSASYSKPRAHLRWDIQGAPPTEDIYYIEDNHSTMPNGTTSIISMLRFPIHLNNESSVSCVVQHPALTELSTTVIKLPTFVFPNVNMEVTLIEEEKAFHEVLCKAEGGRPHPSITWIPESADIPSFDFINDVVSSTSYFPIDDYEGKNITCIFDYPHISAIRKSVTLPAYYITSLQVTNSSVKVNHLNTSDLLILEEEANDLGIRLEILGNVPRYKINCTKDGQPLSEDVKVLVSGLMIKGPVGKNHAGEYLCQASYYKHIASLHFEIEVKPRVRVPAPIDVTLLSNTSWENGIEYTEVKCIVANMSSDANITWNTEDCSSGIQSSGSGKVFEIQHHHDVIWNKARLPVLSYAGCIVICVVHHPGLEKSVQKSIHIPLKGPSRNYLSIGLQNYSTQWAAVCEYKTDGTITNISWVISDNNKPAIPLTINITSEGNIVLATCIYKFELYKHEGKFLTCEVNNHYGAIERRTMQVPSFFVSSIMVLNKTILLHGSHGQHTDLNRVALKEHISNQKIFFIVKGNVPECNIKCFRSNGVYAHTDGMALVFAHQVSESDAGLYTCIASWYHHNATITVLVDVTSQEIQSMMLFLICFASAVAITFILTVTLCILCKRNGETCTLTQDWKKHESLAALMQDPQSSQVNNTRRQGQDNAELVHYSIVIDVKSTV